MSLHHAGQPRGVPVRAGDSPAPLQAHVPEEQGEADWSVSALLSPRALPLSTEKTGPEFPLPKHPPEKSR